MQLEKLKYIIKIAECGSITKASKELYVSQPSLTKVISSIEREYGIKIFERVKSGVILTESGKIFISYSKNIIREFEALNDVFKEENKQNKDELHVYFQSLDFIPEILLDTYKSSESKFLEFNFNNTTRYKIIEGVQKGYADIGILIKTNKESKTFDWQLSSTNLEVEVLDTSDIYICVGEKSELYNKKEIEFKDVRDKVSICLDIDNFNKADWLANTSDIVFKFNKVVYTTSLDICRSLLQNTDIILYTHKWASKYFENIPVRYEKIVNNNIYSCELVCIKRKNTVLLPIEEKFIEILKNNLEKNL